MEGSRANNEMISINTPYSNYNLNGSTNCVSVSANIGSLFINGGSNKVFLQAQIDTMIINGNSNKINVSIIIVIYYKYLFHLIIV